MGVNEYLCTLSVFPVSLTMIYMQADINHKVWKGVVQRCSNIFGNVFYLCTSISFVTLPRENVLADYRYII